MRRWLLSSSSEPQLCSAFKVTDKSEEIYFYFLFSLFSVLNYRKEGKRNCTPTCEGAEAVTSCDQEQHSDSSFLGGGCGVLCGYLTCPNPLLLCNPV